MLLFVAYLFILILHFVHVFYDIYPLTLFRCCNRSCHVRVKTREGKILHRRNTHNHEATSTLIQVKKTKTQKMQKYPDSDEKDLKYPKYPRPKYITHINNINTIYHLSLNNFPDPGAKDRGGKDGGDAGKP